MADGPAEQNTPLRCTPVVDAATGRPLLQLTCWRGHLEVLEIATARELGWQLLLTAARAQGDAELLPHLQRHNDELRAALLSVAELSTILSQMF